MRLATMTITAALTGLAAGAAGAADLTVEIAGLRSAAGLVRVAVCPEDSFTKPQCPHVAVVPATAGAATVRGIPPGTYAVQVFHDEDADGELDRRAFWPTEGLGFSRDAPMRMGPPNFADAALRINGNGTIRVTMRYFG